MKEMIVHPPTAFVLTILCEVFLHFYFPVIKIIPTEFRYLGWVIIIFAVLLSFWQGKTMHGKTPIPYGNKPKTLITSGPFKFTRNAFYLSILLICFGVAVYLTDLSPFIVVVAEFFVFDKYFIPKEETILEKTLGQDYLEYKQKVRRWI